MSRAALERLLASDGDRLYALALRVTRDPDLAADALHDGFAAALESVGDFRHEAALSTWLFRIVYNKAVDRLRERSREQPLDDDPADAVQAKAVRSWSHPPEARLLGEESRQALERALAALSPLQRAVFELREVEQRPTDEVAAILGMPPGTVRVHLHRARLRLRARLSPHFAERRA